MTRSLDKKPAAILFDLDGTLVDSFDAHIDAWLECGRQHGVALGRDILVRTFGGKNSEIIPLYWESGGAMAPKMPRSPLPLPTIKRPCSERLPHGASPRYQAAASCCDSRPGLGILARLHRMPLVKMSSFVPQSLPRIVSTRWSAGTWSPRENPIPPFFSLPQSA